MLDIARSLLISFFAVAVLLPVIRYAFRTMSPAQHAIAYSAEELKYLQKKERNLTFAYFFFACILAVFSTGSLAMLSSIIHMSREDMYVLTPNFRALIAPGLLLGLTLAMIPLYFVQRTLLGQEYNMYKDYLGQIEGRRSTRAYGILLVVMLVISGVVAWFALRWHVNITDQQIRVTTILEEERTYSMQDITRISYLGAEGEYQIDFNDQTNINTSYLKPVQLEMIALLAERSDRRVIR